MTTHLNTLLQTQVAELIRLLAGTQAGESQVVIEINDTLFRLRLPEIPQTKFKVLIKALWDNQADVIATVTPDTFGYHVKSGNDTGYVAKGEFENLIKTEQYKIIQK